MQTRHIIVLLGGIGLCFIGVALGLIYMDFRAREGAWVELSHRPHISDSERDALMAAWDAGSEQWGALVAGSLGAALCGAGGIMLILELRWFQRKDDRAEG